MKKNDVHIGGHYRAKVSDKLVTIEILAENPQGGWDAKNLSTGKKVRIKTAHRLRGKAANATPPAAKKPTPATQSPKPKAANTGEPGTTGGKTQRLSILDAAFEVLSTEKQPLGCSQMIEQMADMKLWQPRNGGKTPANTLYAALLREIKAKGKDSRFTKAERGKFALNG